MALIEKISGLTAEEAKTILLKDVENQTKHEAAMMVKEIEQEAKENAEKKAKNIVSLAIQKLPPITLPKPPFLLLIFQVMK